MISCFKNCTSQKVLNEIDVYTAIDIIQNPQPAIKQLIYEGRKLKKEGRLKEYINLKRSLPCVTFNFNFKGFKSNKNINKSTGFIYIDVDNNINIDLKNPFIFASWISLSGKGRGILVKVNYLSLNNFKKTYDEISRTLNISSDKGAAKATQFTVLSYDKNVYLNNESLTWEANKHLKKEPNTEILKKKKKGVIELGSFCKVRYNNINEFDFKGNDYLFFKKQKAFIAELYIPKKIKNGERNYKLSAIAFQARALNPNMNEKDFKKFIKKINFSVCENPLNKNEIESILRKVLALNDIKPILNKKRLVLFNPKSNLSKQQKQNIVGKCVGIKKSENSINDIRISIDNWSINKGKITQLKLAKYTNKNIKTIQKYYKKFKDQIKQFNSSLKK